MDINKPVAANPESFKYNGTVTARLPENAQLHHITEVGPEPVFWTPGSAEQAEARSDRVNLRGMTRSYVAHHLNALDLNTGNVAQLVLKDNSRLWKKLNEVRAQLEAAKLERARRTAQYVKRYKRRGQRMKRDG